MSDDNEREAVDAFFAAPSVDPEQAKQGFFWGDMPSGHADHTERTQEGAIVKVAAAFFDEMERRSEKVNPLKLDGPISRDEWHSARGRKPAIVDQWFYVDVGVFIAPGGTGKTTLLLFQAICIALGLDLFGYEVRSAGPVVILTAEDSRETLVARLRFMCHQLGLTDEQVQEVRESVIITDVSGKGIKLTTVEKDVVMPSKVLDRLIVEVGFLCPSLLIIDPMVSFGVGESRINDAEQAMIDAARRIVNTVQCTVLYVHHTGKANARDKTTDQYSGRGGSALADGARMVHVLQRLNPAEWTQATGDSLGPDDSGFVLARPKMTWCPPQPDIYIKRRGYGFERIAAVDPTEGAGAITRQYADKVDQFLREEFLKGNKHTGRTLAELKLMPRQALRSAIERLMTDGRLVSEAVTTGRGGARTFLRPIDRPN
ncbi:MAG TPA: AAA family ATPase [Sphingobium sp.]|nr:AAA family ATPase [Sphingobium sp.]